MRRARAVKLVELFVIAIIVLAVRAVSSHAAGLGTIEGTIQSQSGAALSGAHVAVTGKGINRMTTTDAGGHFSIGGLPDGTYKVIAAHAGFVTSATKVTITSAQTMSIRLSLAATKAANKPKLDAKKTEVAPAEEREMPMPRPSRKPAPPPPMAMGRIA